MAAAPPDGAPLPGSAPPVARLPRRAAHVAAASLLLLLAVRAERSALDESPTFDETSHLVSGMSYWVARDFRLNPESGIFPQLWAALPVWRGGAVPPDLGGAAWALGDDWRLAQQFLYGVGNDADTLMRRSRRMIIALAMGLGALVYAWSLRLFGPGGALVSLWLFAFCPNLLAHARLVTADMALAATLCLALAANWSWMQRVSPLRLFGAGLATGLACLSKFAALLLLPVLLLSIAVRVASPRAPVLALGGAAPVEGRVARVAVLLGGLAWVGVGAALAVWAAHGFAFRAGEATPLGWERIEAMGGAAAAAILWARDQQLLPETWLYGLGYTLETTRERVAFAAGQWGTRGWWWYFPFAVGVKTPVGTLGLWALAASGAAVRWWRVGRGARWRTFEPSAPLWALIAVYAASSLLAQVNIGLRHLLPALAAAMILAGSAVRLARARSGRVLLLALLAATAVESQNVAPHDLAFFNRLAGGPARGYRLLIDSNLDWGQDLPGLARWLAAERARGVREPCYLSYFGSALPEAHGVACTRLPGFFDFARPRRATSLEPGIYAISATMLQMLHVPLDVRGEWNDEREARWVELRERLAGETGAGGAWSAEREAYERLRFARLAAWLRRREPDASIGWSILVYRLDARQLDAALYGEL